MIAIFLIAAFVVCLIVIGCFVSQSDTGVLTITHWHTVYLYFLIVAMCGIPLALIPLGNRVIPFPAVTTFRYAVVFTQFVLLATVYTRYHLTGVLALHLSGIVMYLLYAAIIAMKSLVESGGLPGGSADVGLFLGLAAVSGSLASAAYSLVYIAVRRKKGISTSHTEANTEG